MNKIWIACFLILNVFTVFSQNIKPGEPWFDTDGNIINAHGGGMLYHKGSYYWFGEFKGYGKNGNIAMDGVSCYSSKDLSKWENEGLALKMIPDTNSMLQPGCILERPKVIYNEKTKKFVMWFHHELKGKGYNAALTGLAVSDYPSGPYTYLKSIRPHQNIWPTNFSESQKIIPRGNTLSREDKDWREKVKDGALVRRDFTSGQMSRDMTLYVDDDGSAYHIASSEDNQTLHVSKLSDDHLSFTNEYYRILPGGSNEAPAIFKHQGKYYLFSSGTTGWKPNPGRSFVADHIQGPWKSLGNPVVGTEDEQETTFHSQSTYILALQGKENKYIYMGDRWTPDIAAEGKYIWLPINFESGKPVIKWLQEWNK